MTVALVSSRNAQATGVDRYARSLADAMRALGADVEPVELRRRETALGPVRVGGLASLWVQRLLRERGSHDIVHALDPSVATRGSDIVTVHDLIVESHPQWVGGGAAVRLDWAISRANTRRAPLLLAVSRATRDEIVQRWQVPESRVRVVHEGIDAEMFHPVDDASQLVASEGPTLSYVGDDNPRKNLQLAVRAAAALGERHGIRARLLRMGPSRYPDAPHRSLAKRLDVELVEPGFVSDDELRAALSRSAAFLWPSLAEGFGFPPLEAMACGTPVVALDVPVSREILAPLAKLHDDTPEDAADAIAAVLRAPPSREALREHARRFTWERCARETLAVYEEVRPK